MYETMNLRIVKNDLENCIGWTWITNGKLGESTKHLKGRSELWYCKSMVYEIFYKSIKAEGQEDENLILPITLCLL